MNENFTNEELVRVLGLPADIITSLQSSESTTYVPAHNAFISAIVNKIVYQKVDKMDFVDPFKKYDSFPIEYGDTIENVYTELPKGYTFDPDATDPFEKYIPNVKVLYATINFKMQYALTVSAQQIRQACLNEHGFTSLINSLLDRLAQATELDTYYATISMLNNSDATTGIYANGLETVTKGTTQEETAKIMTAKIVDVASSFVIPSVANNKLGVKTCSNKNDVLLIIKRELFNSINLDYLTGVYNLDKVELVKNSLQVETFKVENADGELVGDDIDFVIIDTKGFDDHIALQDSGSIYNPKGAYTNHFTNLWKIISFKYFRNARAFKLVDPQGE